MTMKSCAAAPFHGSRLRELRVTLGWTQPELARRCGLSVGRIGLLELGRCQVRADDVEAMCAALKVPPSVFALPSERNPSKLRSCLARRAARRRSKAQRLANAARFEQWQQEEAAKRPALVQDRVEHRPEQAAGPAEGPTMLGHLQLGTAFQIAKALGITLDELAGKVFDEAPAAEKPAAKGKGRRAKE